MTKEQLLYDLAREIFLRKLPIDYLTDRTEKGQRAIADNAIKMAKLFYEQVEQDEQEKRND